MARYSSLAALIFSLVVLAGCASVETKKEWTGLEKDVQKTSAAKLVWKKTADDEAKVKVLIDQALAGGLTQEEAVAVALINNRSLQASFERIGISKADLVQAGLFHNPMLTGLFRFPIKGDESGTNVELAASFTASDFWLAPLKRDVSEITLQRVTREVGRTVLQTRRDARYAYLGVYFLKQKEAKAAELLESMNELAAAAQRRREFGYESKLDVYLTQTAAAQAETELDEVRMELRQAQAVLARVLGMAGKGANLKLSGEPAPIPHMLPSEEKAAAFALGHRPEVQITKLQAAEARRRLKLEKARIVKEVQLGLNWERETGGEEVLGPEFEMDLPIFDQNQAMIARAEFMVRMAEKKLMAIEGEITEEVINDLEEVKFLKRKLGRTKNRVIPLREQSLTFAKKWANLMQVSRLLMLETQKDLHESQLELIDTRLHLHQALNHLEYNLGGKIPAMEH